MILKKKKDLNYRLRLFENELDLRALKFVSTCYLSSRSVDSKNKSRSVYFLNVAFSKHKKSKTRVVRRCISTNRSRGVLRKCGLSRILMKDLILSGNIGGYKKLS